ncbi:MAG: Do family serine endopeptidase [Acidobacteriota bacterium]
MSRGQFVVMTLMMTVAVLAGVLTAALVPPVVDAQAKELKLAPAPPPSAAVVVPSFADLAERALPSVVRITTKAFREAGRDPLRDHPFFRRFFNDEPDTEQEPELRPEYMGGSGFFITADGYLLTNKHVVQDGEEFLVRTFDGKEYKAQLVGTDPYTDVALLKVDTDEPVTPLPLGDSDTVRVGEWVMAIGHPVMLENTVTVGIVSGKGRRLIGAAALDVGSYIQTDAAINRGNSGGPLINTRGEVIGINTAIIRGGMAQIEGIGFALPITMVKDVLDQLVETGTVKRGWLGVTVQAVDDKSAEFYGLDAPHGALVQSVTEGGPAESAGVSQGDVIIAVDGEEVIDSSDLVEKISRHRPGDRVELELLTSGETGKPRRKTVTVELGERGEGLRGQVEPQETGGDEGEGKRADGDVSALGFTVAPLPDGVRRQLERDGLAGVLVIDVDPKSDAFDEGLQKGNIVLSVNGKPTPDLESFREAIAGIRSGQVVRMTVLTRPRADQRLLFFRAP